MSKYRLIDKVNMLICLPCIPKTAERKYCEQSNEDVCPCRRLRRPRQRLCLGWSRGLGDVYKRQDCNQHRLGGTLETKTLEGWGYDYYVFDNVTSPVSTMMACPEGKKEQKFVTAWLGEDGMLRYNSKLPIVVYTPANVDVKYRIWKADANVQNAVTR